jgi:hypothetical protein
MQTKVTSDIISYTNHKKTTSYLYQKISKQGKVSYYFSSKLKENPLTKIPEGYEIRERPETSQVFLQKKIPCLISESEKKIVYSLAKKLHPQLLFKIDVKLDKIVIYTAKSVADHLKNLSSTLNFLLTNNTQDELNTLGHYSPKLRFTLIDSEKRLFSVERWCFRGSVDDWIYILGSGSLEILCEKTFPHLEKDTFFNLQGQSNQVLQ